MDNSCTVLKERIARRIVFGWLALAKQIFPVGQIRLPNNLFTEYAGTEVGSDLTILRKIRQKKI